MTYRKYCFFLAVAIFVLSGCSRQMLSTPGGWKLTWRDEFNGTGNPDPEKWEQPENNRRNNNNGPDGWWSAQDAYLDGAGHLVIRAREIPNRNNDCDSNDYSTGAVRSRGRFEQQYGRFEVRCKLPAQQGWWVAFWLMSPTVGHVDGSGEDGAEIDIFEGFGWTDTVQHALHWDGYGDAHRSEGHKMTIEGIREEFHVYALEWSPEEYVFSIDGRETWRSKAGGVSQVPAYIKVTGELSTEDWAKNRSWANDPAKAVFPDHFIVDYVRVYQKR